MNDLSASGTADGSADEPQTPPGSGRPDDAGRARAGETGSVEPPSRPPTPMTQQIGRGVVVLLAVVFGVFAVANSQHVAFSWLFGETHVVTDAMGERVTGGVPLIVLMVASLVIGIAVGAAWVRLVERARRRRKD